MTRLCEKLRRGKQKSEANQTTPYAGWLPLVGGCDLAVFHVLELLRGG